MSGPLLDFAQCTILPFSLYTVPAEATLNKFIVAKKLAGIIVGRNDIYCMKISIQFINEKVYVKGRKVAVECLTLTRRFVLRRLTLAILRSISSSSVTSVLLVN